MLSYRHAYHAGNHADVIKHVALTLCLDHMTNKPAPVLYLDTHAGAGEYSLADAMAQQNQEYESGIDALNFAKLPDCIKHYQTITQIYKNKQQYPGSPAIAAHILRAQDKLKLYELHPADFPNCQKTFRKDKRVKIAKQDGYAGLKASLPSPIKRALVLLDPSYEVKTEYHAVVKSVIDAHKRMATASFLIWYPVVKRQNIRDMQRLIEQSTLKNVWQFELAMQADSDQYGMTASGLFAINPPWQLANQMREVLPAIQQQIAPHGSVTIKEIVAE